jgi:hypothetical protein
MEEPMQRPDIAAIRDRLERTDGDEPGISAEEAHSLLDYIESIEDRLEGGSLGEAPQSTGWQPIETAPKDRKIIVTCWFWWTPVNGDNRWERTPVSEVTFDPVRGFDTSPYMKPTHWLDDPACPHLAEPPSTEPSPPLPGPTSVEDIPAGLLAALAEAGYSAAAEFLIERRKRLKALSLLERGHP